MSDSQDLVAHMRPVLSAERDLRDLTVIWQMIEASAAIGCPDEAEQVLTTLNGTRTRLDALQIRLIEQMVLQNRAELGDELIAKAQCTIDILVRNLYERTADVGFLATDDGVRSFCAAPAAERETGLQAMVRRLAEYQAKYTVYDDIVLLSPQGAVLARLDTQAVAVEPQAAMVAEVLGASGYVERFGPTALAADGRPALTYAHAIHTDGGQPIGVLVLKFRFGDEMTRIFEGVVDDPHRAVLTLVDERGVVIATSDEAHIPTGARTPALPTGDVTLTSFAGREYLATCCESNGYQGYRGPRWRALAMVSLLTAFRQRSTGAETDADVPLDNSELMSVQTEAQAINRDLRCALWNGRVLIGSEGTDRQRLKAVLRQVSQTGGRTRSRVTQAIHDIYRVALSRSRHQARELARLAADIMDRNLYERANDCRWWALSPVIQRVLAEAPTAENTLALQQVLTHINGLYTVYSQLVVFDLEGVIRGVSVASSADRWVGQTIPADWLERLGRVSSTQAYAVSAFEPTPLHDGGDTYVYLAAVREANHSAVTGGIAVVFNAERELTAMLRDIVGERAGFAAFVDGTGRVLAASHPTLAHGATVSFSGDDAVVEHEGAHYACARVRAPGYREFKTSDDYDNGVSAIVGLRLGASERRRTNFSDLDILPASPVPPDSGTEMAVFQVGAARYALPANAVLEAISCSALVRTPSLGGTAVGMVEVTTRSGPRMARVLCARKLFDVPYPARQTDGVLLVLRSTSGNDESLLALRVDDVLNVIEVAAEHVHPAPPGLQQSARWITALVECAVTSPAGRSPALLQQLAHDRLLIELGATKVAA